jgi:glycerate kinase
MTLPRLPHGASVVIAPDSFKGSIDAVASAAAIGEGWSAVRGQDRLRLVPMADGGEGTLGIVAAQFPGTRMTALLVEGPNGEPVRAQYAVLPDGTAMVELAASSGLPLARRLDARRASTYGFGQVLAHAAAQPDVRKLLIGLGGSATTDGAAGALHALGARLLDEDGRELPRGGAALQSLARVDLDRLMPPPPDGVECMVDVTAPLLGPLGAAAQFGPQKGATPADVDVLEQALTRWARLVGGAPEAPGAGAAGGACYGLVTAWGATARPGAAAIADLVGLPHNLDDADILITGEGRFDDQSLRGKVVGHVLSLALERGVPVVVVAGSATDGRHREGVQVCTLVEVAGNVEAAKAHPQRWLHECGRRLAQAVGKT